MFEDIGKGKNCDNCSHQEVCKYKDCYDEAKRKISNALDDEFIYLINVDLNCLKFEQDKGVTRQGGL